MWCLGMMIGFICVEFNLVFFRWFLICSSFRLLRCGDSVSMLLCFGSGNLDCKVVIFLGNVFFWRVLIMKVLDLFLEIWVGL